MFTNTKESGFESLIVKWLVEHNGYEKGNNPDHIKEHAIDETHLFHFLQDTQPTQIDKLGVFNSDQKSVNFSFVCRVNMPSAACTSALHAYRLLL